MNIPEVTIVVPIHNGAAYLSETLNSLLSQTFRNFELLAIDDGSTDNSREILHAFCDERVRLVQQNNFGLCQALNLGIAEAKAPYIARCDQDDISFPYRLERQLRVMDHHSDALALFAYTTKFGKKHRWSNADKTIMAPGQLKEYEPMKDGCLLGSTMFARTAALRTVGGFRQPYYPADDWDLECRLAEAGKVLILREPLIAYRFQSGANTYRVFAEMQQKTRWVKDSYRRRLQSIPELSFSEFLLAQPTGFWPRLRFYCKDNSKLHMRIAGHRFLDGHYLSGAVHLIAGVILNPLNMTGRLRRYFYRF